MTKPESESEAVDVVEIGLLRLSGVHRREVKQLVVRNSEVVAAAAEELQSVRIVYDGEDYVVVGVVVGGGDVVVAGEQARESGPDFAVVGVGCCRAGNDGFGCGCGCGGFQNAISEYHKVAVSLCFRCSTVFLTVFPFNKSTTINLALVQSQQYCLLVCVDVEGTGVKPQPRNPRRTHCLALLLPPPPPPFDGDCRCNGRRDKGQKYSTRNLRTLVWRAVLPSSIGCTPRLAAAEP